MAKHTFLDSSLALLCDIADSHYNEQIRIVAQALWQKHLQADNPQWEFIRAKPFTLQTKTAKAHVLAMIDSRLPDIGIVGYFACTDADSGARVLRQASDWLKHEHGLKNIYGPINGTIPSDYRISLQDDYVIPGEPVNPNWYLEAFEKAGFSTYNKYQSAISGRFALWLQIKTHRPKNVAKLSIRPFNIEKFKSDFKRYNDLRNAIISPQSNYCPAISLAEREYISDGKFDAKYTYFLMDGAQEVGFVMGYIHSKSMILKTIGLLPKYRGKHLSSLLLEPIYKAVKAENIHTIVYALVREGNNVQTRKSPFAKVFRQYVTMRKD